MIRRVILIVLDSVGVGELPDAHAYGDQGSNTLAHTAAAVGGINLPNMADLGLGNILSIQGVPPVEQARGAYGRMAEQSPGKDTTTGHWEIAGIILERPFPVYPEGFPAGLIAGFEQAIGRPVLGNVVASGTQIIEELGEEHVRTGHPIVYTSADSVFQIAAHEEVIPVDELYRMCEIAREMLVGEHAVGRVIARPFVGKPGAWERTPRRHDYSLKPISPTVLDAVKTAGQQVVAVGKIKDIFAGEGITRSLTTLNNMDGVDKTLAVLREPFQGLLFANLVDYDSKYGHRNDVEGYARALEEFDRRLPELLAALRPEDILIITADHGCDPTTKSTDHSREYVPVMVCGDYVLPHVDLGIRETFADLGATVADILGVIPPPAGTTFWPMIRKTSKEEERCGSEV